MSQLQSNMYGEFEPVTIFGFYEPRERVYLSGDTLEEFDVEIYADRTVRLHACNLVYGVNVQTDRSGVLRLAEAYRAAYPDVNIKLGEFLCLRGDFEVGREYEEFSL